MNLVEKNGGVFVRSEIISLRILSDRDKMALAIIDNSDDGFKENYSELADVLRCSELQANNSFEKLKALRYITRNESNTGWIFNDDGPIAEGSL